MKFAKKLATSWPSFMVVVIYLGISSHPRKRNEERRCTRSLRAQCQPKKLGNSWRTRQEFRPLFPPIRNWYLRGRAVETRDSHARRISHEASKMFCNSL